MTKDTQPTKPSAVASAPSPSAGALRAARHFIALGLLTTPIYAAEISDRETGVAELLEAAKRLVTIYRHAYEITGGTGSLPELKPLEHAIAIVEQ